MNTLFRTHPSQMFAGTVLLLYPTWFPVSLRAQELFASRTASRPPAVSNLKTDSKTQPTTLQAPAPSIKAGPIRSSLSGPPVFIENRGQFDEKVSFQVATGGSKLWLTGSGIVFDTLRPKEGPVTAKTKRPHPDPRSAPPLMASDFERLVVSEDFVAANPRAEFEPRTPQPGIYNYLIGNDRAKWHTNVKAYGEVVYRNVWDGVDLRLYFNGSGLEQEFVLAPGGDASQIRVQYKGIEGLRIADDGALLILTPFGQWRETAPKVYQEIAGKRVAIEARFKIVGNASYAFELDSYRKQYAVIIDPTLLYSTYIGGSGQGNYGTEIAVDSAGSAYVTGYTTNSTYPTTTGVFQFSCPSTPYCNSGVVSKFDAVGGLQYSTYLGSTGGRDYLMGIAVDGSGNAYTTGLVDVGFPTTPSAFQASCSTSGSALVAQLNSTGTALLYSTCIGGGMGFPPTSSEVRRPLRWTRAVGLTLPAPRLGATLPRLAPCRRL